MGFVFGQDVPCRGCHGTGERVGKMTPEQQRERNRELRRAKRSGETPDHISVLKPCPECGGRGYVSPSIADARR